MAPVPPSGGMAHMQQLWQLKDFLYTGEEKCKAHLIKLLISTSVLTAQWREGAITVLNLCLCYSEAKEEDKNRS